MSHQHNKNSCSTLNSIRHKWLKAMGLFYAAQILSAGLTYVFLMNITEAAHEALISSTGMAIAQSIVFLIMWFCAYRKPGTKYIGFWVFVSPFGQIMSLKEFENFNNWPTQLQLFTALVTAIYFLGFIYFWIHTHHLWQLNKKLSPDWKTEAAKVECREYVLQMEKATSQSELDRLFAAAVIKWPDWQKQLAAVYKKCKQKIC